MFVVLCVVSLGCVYHHGGAACVSCLQKPCVVFNYLYVFLNENLSKWAEFPPPKRRCIVQRLMYWFRACWFDFDVCVCDRCVLGLAWACYSRWGAALLSLLRKT